MITLCWAASVAIGAPILMGINEIEDEKQVRKATFIERVYCMYIKSCPFLGYTRCIRMDKTRWTDSPKFCTS